MRQRRSSTGAVENAYRLLATVGDASATGAILLCTSTIDLDSGRGDLYVAAALGRALQDRGHKVALLPRGRWKNVPRDAAAVVAMLPQFDPAAVPSDVPLIAWVRNETQRWIEVPNLAAYDGILASSRLSLDLIAECYDGPTAWLPLAADPDLFVDLGKRRRNVVSSVNGWGRERDLHRALEEIGPQLHHVDLYGETKGLPASVARIARGPVSYFRLPEIYAQALLVLDDMNHTTLPYGNLNSRLYEALAAGALPVVNGRLGLNEVGLEDVPSYRDADELKAIIDDALARPAETISRAQRLRDTVLREHTFAQRAQTFESFVVEVTSARSRRRPMLTFVPDYSKWNTFQDMLYTSTRAAGARVVAGDLLGLNRLAARDSGGRADDQVFHIHWTAPLLQSARTPYDALDRLSQFRAMVTDFRSRGGKVVWTIHNVLPHEVTHRVAEIELCRFLAANADAIHVLSKETIDATAALYELPADRTHVIEHSSYVGVYPDIIDREEARRRLHVQPSETALLLFGGIRPYKGVSDVLGVFEEALRRRPGLRLLVAGQPGRFAGVQKLTERFLAHPHVTANFEFVPDDELQVWQRAADVAVLPYPSVLNSGAFQLALSFGLPVIAPRSGSFLSLLDPRYTLSYRRGDQEQLIAAMTAAPELAKRAGCSARAAADERPPAQMSDRFLELLRGIGWELPAG